MRKTDCALVFLLVAAACATFSASAETFRNPVRVPTDSDPAGVFVADLNNDKLPDIVWGSYGSAATPGIVHTLLAQASGGFLPGPTMTMPTNVGSVCLPADENGDGIVDLVCPSAFQFTASIYTFPGKGDGSFGTPIITPIPTLPSNGAWVSIIFHPLADLNGDGIADLMVLEGHTGAGYVMLGDGHGGFTKSSTFNSYGKPQVMDVNGDGKVDLLFPGGGVWLGKGDGTFTQFASVLYVFGSCSFSDMDGDGHPDAVCGVPEAINGDITGGTQLLIFHGKGDGSFDPTPIKTVTYGDHSNESNGYGTFNYPLAVTDVNGDGVPDILAEAGDGLTVILGYPKLEFGSPAHYATGYLPGTSAMGLVGEYAMQVVDLNNDGLPDLVSVGPNGIYIAYARKDGTYDTAPAYEVGQLIGYQTVADFNEDGTPDVAATGDLSIELNLGKGDGTFQAPVDLPSGGINFSTPLSATNAHILHGDFNGDHHQDILAVGSSAIYQYDSYVLFGDGTGSFSSPQLVPNSSQIYPAYDSRVVVDLNHDGRDDLFGSDDSHLYASLSNGDGTFTTITTTIASPGVRSTAVLADFDHDGKVDALWAAGPNVMVSKGNGDGTFDSNPLSLPIPTSISSYWNGAAVTAGDFDGDGNQDIALLIDAQSGTVASAVFVFYGKGDGTFTPGALAGTFNRSYTGVYAADLNKEGLDDLILKTSGSLGGGYAVGIVDSLPGRAFGPEVNYYAGTGLADISIADLNHDGFPDLLFSNCDYNIRASSVTVLMNQGNSVTGTLTATPEPSSYNQPLTLDAAFVPSSFTPLTGTVTFAIDGKSVGSASISSNKASLPVSTPIPAGTHALTATLPGNSIYSAVTLTASHQISPVPSSVTLSSSLNPALLGESVTFTASIASAVPADSSDTVTFYDGQTKLGTAVPVTSGQTSTFSTSSLGVGSHSITAVYSGNTNILGSTSSTLTQSVVYFVGDFSIQATPAAATVNGGQTAAFQLAITPSGGFAAPLAFSCSGLPALATCSFSPSTIPSGQGQVAFNIQTAGSAQSASLRPSSRAGGTAAILAALVFWLLPSGSRSRRYISLFVLAIFTLATLSMTSCGGGGGGSGTSSTPTGSYQVSVKAQTTEPSQNMSHSSVITLNVK